MECQQLKFYTSTIDWYKDGLIDWGAAGAFMSLDGQEARLNTYSYVYLFDAVISSSDGQYVFLYTRLGTKGLLIKNGELLREINRSYYCAEAYEYPAAFITHNGRTYLVHCPLEYCQLDFEDVETGELVTNIPGRNAVDIFHSRLLVSPDGRSLLSRGWVWHPLHAIRVFNISECFENPLLLDRSICYPASGTEVNVADFIDSEHILIGSSEGEGPLDDETPPALPDCHIAVWNFNTNEISGAVKIEGPFGNLFVIDATRAWDLYQYPKIIQLQTGMIESQLPDLESGIQSSSFLSKDPDACPQIKFDRNSGKIAIRVNNETVKVLTP